MIIHEEGLQNILRSLKRGFAFVALVANLAILPMTLMLLFRNIGYVSDVLWGESNLYFPDRNLGRSLSPPFLSMFLFMLLLHLPAVAAAISGLWINSKSLRRYCFFESFMLMIPYWLGKRKDRSLVLRYKGSRFYPLFKHLVKRLARRLHLISIE